MQVFDVLIQEMGYVASGIFFVIGIFLGVFITRLGGAVKVLVFRVAKIEEKLDGVERKLSDSDYAK